MTITTKPPKHLRLALVVTPPEGAASLRLFEGTPRKALKQAQDAAQKVGATLPAAHVQILVLGTAQARMGDILERARRVRQSNAAYIARAALRLVKGPAGTDHGERLATLDGLGAALSGRAHPAM